MQRQHPFPPQRSGIVLLVVLHALTFFSILVATYLVFSSQARDSSFAIAKRNSKAPDVNEIMDEALMTLIRGTADSTNPFYGEDLLSDLYGRRDSMTLGVHHVPTLAAGPALIGGGFVRFPASGMDGATRYAGNSLQLGLLQYDDVLAGRLITFLEGPLANLTFRVIRSEFVAAAASGVPMHDNLFIELNPEVFNGVTPTALQVRELFYADGTNLTTGGYNFHVNGEVRNSKGLGYSGVNVEATTNDFGNTNPITGNPYVASLGMPGNPFTAFHPTNNPAVGFDVPVSLQPNHLGNQVRKDLIPGDFDEDYDAPDHQNWFLSHRFVDPTGLVTVTPSFHRPAVLNYLLNEVPDWASASDAEYRDIMASMVRATFRPIPISQAQLRVDDPSTTTVNETSIAFNPRFTGGSDEFALRVPLLLRGDNSVSGGTAADTAELDQLCRALITGTWDVDNDADGIPDSLWIDLGLPPLTSPEGKVVKPLIAPMIEDLGGRLNLNALGNGLIPYSGAGFSTSQADWSKTATEYAAQYDPMGTGVVDEFVFRGLGWGPAEGALPITLFGGTLPAAQRNAVSGVFNTLFNQRYRFGQRQLAAQEVPGTDNRDIRDAIRFGYRPLIHVGTGNLGYSDDPFGRGGVALGRDGNLVAANSGLQISVDDPMTTGVVEPTINEAINNPYEMDPTGDLAGDSPFTFAEFEALLRQFDFDTELLPERLADRFNEIATTNATLAQQLARSVTPHSRSLDNPKDLATTLPPGGTPTLAQRRSSLAQDQESAIASLIRTLESLNGTGAIYTQAELDRLLAPELRLGNKLDINRRIGNFNDDNGNGVFDEPLETNRSDADGIDNDGDMVTDEQDGSEKTRLEAEGYVVQDGVTTLPADYIGQHPNYTFDSPALFTRDINNNGTIDGPTRSAGDPLTTIFESEISQAHGRQLLARHLYVLMMMITRDLTSVTAVAPEIPVDPATQALAGYDPQLYRAQRIAQWAVNVVDYRDSDSIMTAFEYDPDPFTKGGPAGGGIPRFGWDVDGNLNTIETLSVSHSVGGTPFAIPRPVVWGVEQPDLVFSESLAFHDVRVRDTNRDDNEREDKTSGTTPDNDTDQVRIPQGSLFLELYCPRPVVTPGNQATKSAYPRELFTAAGNLDLTRRAPLPGGGALGAPVWRIAITEPHFSGSGNEAEDPALRRDNRPDTASFDLARPDEIDPTVTGTLGFDRFIFFDNVDETAGGAVVNPDTNPTAAYNNVLRLLNDTGLSTATDQTQRMLANQIFYTPILDSAPAALNLNQNRLLAPGQYLTLAPRISTHLGSREFAGTVPGLPSQQRFELFDAGGTIPGMNQVSHTNAILTPALGPQPAPYTFPSTLLIAAPRPVTWAIADPAHPNLLNNVVGLSVSEPLPHAATAAALGAPAYYPQPLRRYNGTIDADMAGGEDYLLSDAYIDFTDATTFARDTPVDVGLGRIPVLGGEPVTGTTANYCTAFLQRLADPTLPFNEITNPYRTIDWMTVDLTVFSGEERESSIGAAGTYAQRSRQRNGAMRNSADPTGVAPSFEHALYSYETDFDATGVSVDTTSADFFRLAAAQPHVGTSLGFLNNTNVIFNPGYVGFTNSIGSLGAENINTNDRNLPQTPFASHPWLNRPFATPAELLLVPACSQARLFEEFTVIPTGGGDPAIYPPTLGAPPTIAEIAAFRGGFRHLLNFFASTDPAATATDVPEFHRIFDLVHTRPRFSGEVELVDPTRIAGGGAAMQTLRDLLSAPFSELYDNRRVGTVNLNTISQFQTWAGLMQGHLNADEFISESGNGTATQLSFFNWLDARRGYSLPGTVQRVNGTAPYNYDGTRFSPEYPTEFAGVARSPMEAPFAIDVRNSGTVEPLRRREVHSGLLRGEGALDENDPVGGTPTDDAFFVRDSGQSPNAAPNPHLDRAKNPFVRYQTLMRMPNLVSDNSQVFLVRLTLGFFELDAETGNLGTEYNSDIGASKRYKAMFIVDRSIPVGFLPGQDLNARDVVIFESYAE